MAMANAPLSEFDPTEHTLLEVLDHYARLRPNAIFAEYPQSPLTYSRGYLQITYLDLANAVNGAARWLIETIGMGDGSTKLAYIGPNDVRYSVLTLASIKAGYSMFFPSPRNSVLVQRELLQHLRCKVILCPSPRPSHIIEILKTEEMHVLDVPATQDLLATGYPPLPFRRSLQEVLTEPLLTIHTSGSTRLAQPMTFTHDTARKGLRMHCLNAPEGYESLNNLYYGKRVFLVLPPFHGACLASLLLNALPFSTIMIAPLSGAIPSASGMVEGIKQSRANVAIVPPSILEELVQEPNLIEYCAHNLDCIIYCGGDLPQQIGDMVAAKIPLYNQYGSTELGLTPMILSKVYREPEDWKYVEFHPDLGLQFRPAMDDLYELCMVHRTPVEGQQLVFTYPSFTDACEYATGDLFERHPSHEKSALWTWRCRRDDIIVLTNGEKINPIGMEHSIISHSRLITGAIVTGSQHFQPILLLETKQDMWESKRKDRNALLEDIWPIIQEANQIVPAYARIERSHIIFTQSEKPMRRSAKGTIQRAATVKLYHQELEALHAMIEFDCFVEEGLCVLHPDQMSNHHTVAGYIQQAIEDVTRWEYLGAGDDFYVRGMDSQQTLSAVRILRRGLPGAGVSPGMLYANPSVAALTQAVVDKSRKIDWDSQQSGVKKRLIERKNALQKYQGLIDQIPRAEASHCRQEGHFVLLTDSINGLGPYILDILVRHPLVAHIYCLSHVENGGVEQIDANQRRQLETTLDPQKITFLEANISQKNLGLPSGMIDDLRQRVTSIIHNAWPINLNWSFRSFDPHLLGLINLIRFCTVTFTSPKFFWVSSIGALLKLQGDLGTLPEQMVQMDQPSVNNYGESRYVGEQLLRYAHDRLGIPISIARLTYTPGAINRPSVWSPDDWLSGLVAASLQMGTLPDSLGQRWSHVDWIPVDILSHILVNLALSDSPCGEAADIADPALQVFHPVNLHPVDWRPIHDIIIEEIQRITGQRLISITLQEWIQKIQIEHDSQITGSDHAHDPNLEEKEEKGDPPFGRQKLSGLHSAMRMLDFYRHVFASDAIHALPETEKTARWVVGLRSIPAVQDEWVRKWVREWVEVLS